MSRCLSECLYKPRKSPSLDVLVSHHQHRTITGSTINNSPNNNNNHYSYHPPHYHYHYYCYYSPQLPTSNPNSNQHFAMAAQTSFVLSFPVAYGRSGYNKWVLLPQSLHDLALISSS